MTTSIAPPSSRNNAALGIIGGSFVGIMALTAPFVLMHVRSPLPYMATSRRKVEKALAFVASRRRLTRAAESRDARGLVPNHRPSGTNDDDDDGGGGGDLRGRYVDLGSGDGTSVLAAASLGWHATGLEMNPTLWLVSRMRRLCMFPPRSAERERSEFVLGDMFGGRSGGGGVGGVVTGALLRDADVVMVFGVAPLMPRIADLVMGSCRPGCLLMSYRFRVPLLPPSSSSSSAAAATDIGKGGVPSTASTAVVDAPGGGAMKDGGPIVDGSSSSSSSSGGCIDATLIYDEEEMRIYELKTRSRRVT
ncbi:hypothetical protein ACHAW5_002050 [Stephanodiscus triporus]|uniref:Uncharacterized protein n=1 Tax=Stephanodiscus triporus TaxID=2934178 RepID=A0ABD3QL47_9STRA